MYILPAAFLLSISLSDALNSHRLNSTETLKISRNILDTIYGGNYCWFATRTTGKPFDSKCTCKKEYGTVMSNRAEDWNCRTPAEVLCHYSFGIESKTNIYIIETSSASVKVVPQISARSSIEKILIWNRGDHTLGYWDNITDVGMHYFEINRHQKLVIRNLDFHIWNGHVIKIQFGNNYKCALAKFKGSVVYPFDIEKFRRSLNPTNTTREPLTVHKPTTTTEPATTRHPTTSTETSTTRQPTTRQPTTTKEPSTTRQRTTTKEPTTTRQRTTTKEPATTRQPTTTKEPSTTRQRTTTKEPSTTRQITTETPITKDRQSTSTVKTTPRSMNTTLNVTRRGLDFIYTGKCASNSNKSKDSKKCICKEGFGSVMSRDGEKWNCMNSVDVGCKYKVYGEHSTFLIREENSSVRINPPINTADRYIENIMVWNHQSGKGEWHDISNEGSPFFIVEKEMNELKVIDLELNKWQGQVVKIVFGDDNCLVVKIKGNIVYPTDIEKFITSLRSSIRTSTISGTVSTTDSEVIHQKTGAMKTIVTTTTTTTITTTRILTKEITRTQIKDEF